MNVRRESLVAAVCLALAASVAWSGAARALERHTREGWVAGIGYGIGWSKINTGSGLGQLESGWEDGATPEFRFGHMLGKRFQIAYDQRQWMDEQGYGTASLRANFQNFSAALTYFPGNPDNETGGIYLRGGVGFANARLAVNPEAIGGIDSTHSEKSLDEGGVGFQLGGGYEFRVAKPVAVGLDVGLNYQAIESEVFDKTWFVPATLNLTWYF